VLASVAGAIWVSFGIGGHGEAAAGPSASGRPSSLSAGQSQPGPWRSLHGPDGGDISAIATDPADSRVVFATGGDSVFESTNRGANWRKVSRGPWAESGPLAIDPKHPGLIYVGSDQGVAKSVDGGHHWRLIDSGLLRGWHLPPLTSSNGSVVRSLTIDASHPDTVYATNGMGLYRTTNGGARWQLIGPAPFRNARCRHCFYLTGPYAPVASAIDPSDAQTIYASWTRARKGTSELYKSSDGGTSWRQITTSQPLSFSRLAVTASGVLFALSSRPGILRSTDGGVTWSQPALPGETFYGLTVDYGSGAVYASTGGAAFRTTDDGHSWQPVPAGVAGGPVVTDPTDPATVYATSNDGIVKSTDHGRTWFAADNGVVSTSVSALALAPGSPATLYAGTGGSRIFKTSDGGRIWRNASNGFNGGFSVLALAADPEAKGTLYAGSRGFGVFKTTNAGDSWTPVNTGLRAAADVEALAVDPLRPSTVYAVASTDLNYGTGSSGKLFETVDAGTTWHAVGLTHVKSLAVAPQTGTVFAGTTGTLFRSTNRGQSWQRVATLAHPRNFVAIAIDPRNPNTIYTAIQPGPRGIASGGVSKSTNDGKTWVAVNSGLTNRSVGALAIDPRNPLTLFASTGAGVFRSTNGGASWQPFDRGLPAGGVDAFVTDPAGRTIYAATNGDGVAAFPIGG
jgi:photosystem II stability/assembly factor-like uncharacterized protein